MIRSIVAIILFIPVICLGDDNIATVFKGELYRNKQYSFSIKYPNDWLVEKSRHQHGVVRFSTKDGSYLITINVQKIPKGNKKSLNIQGIKKDITTMYASSGYKIDNIKFGKTMFFNKKAVWEKASIYMLHLDNYVYSNAWKLITLHNNKFYVLHFLAMGYSKNKEIAENMAVERFNQFEPTFTQILSSFLFEN